MKTLFIRLLNKFHLLGFFNFQVRLPFGSSHFTVLVKGGVGFIHLFQKERWMKVVLNKLVKGMQGKTFLDVGVNLGQTLLTYKGVVPAGAYIGFEPNPKCVAYVQELMAVNAFTDPLWPFAIGDKDGAAILYADSPEDSAATLVENFRDNYGRIKYHVPVLSSRSLEPLLQQPIGIIKIDVEGGELEVINQLRSVIEKDKPFIICEILPIYSVANTRRLDRQTQLLNLLESWQYRIFRISEDGLFTELQTIGVHANLNDCNYLFVPDHCHFEN